MSDQPTWLTIEDVYEYLEKKVPKDTIRAWVRNKRLPAYRPHRTYLIKREDLEKFLRESRTTPEDI